MGCLANFDCGLSRAIAARSRARPARSPRCCARTAIATTCVGKWHVTPLTETGADRPVRRLAARPRLRPLLRLPRRRDRPVLARAGARQHAASIRPGDYSHRLSPDRRSGRPGHPLSSPTTSPTIADDAVASWARAGRLPRPAPGAARPDRQVRRACSPRAGTSDARASASPARSSSASCPTGTAPAAAQRRACAPGPSCTDDERRLFTRLQARLRRDARPRRPASRAPDRVPRDGRAARRHAGRWCMSDNGASQEGGPLGIVNAMGPFNLMRRADRGEDRPHRRHRRARHPLQLPAGLGDGGQHAAASATSRTPTAAASAIRWSCAWHERASRASGELRHQFCHASDLAPTLLELVGIEPPEAINGVRQMPIEGTSFAASLADAEAPSKQDAAVLRDVRPSRHLAQDGCKAVAFHPPGNAFDHDKWELYHLDRDFNESRRPRRSASPSG